jgi:cell division septal protein FtsQ
MKRRDRKIRGETRDQSKVSDYARSSKQGPGDPWALVVIFFLLTGTFLFLRSPVFLVKNYMVTGAERVPYDEIVARSTQRSSNIFDLKLDKIQKTIETSPWIEEARCTRRFPNTLEITVIERKPVVFAPIGEKIWLIDKEGRVLQEDDGISEGLIALTGVSQLVAPGQFLDQAQYGWALTIITQLGPVAQRRVIEVNVEHGECMLILDDGCKVFIGEEQPGSETGLAVLESILAELEEEAKIAEYIDLRFDKQAVKLK